MNSSSGAEINAPMLPLFAYGTLRDAQYQRELFGRTYPMCCGNATGFVIMSTGSGYLAATRQRGSTIAGALVDLDDAGYATADAWEDRTLYDRILIGARRDDGRMQRCYIYVALDAQGVPVADERLADRTRAEVIVDIRRFRASLLSRVNG